ncbi:hypothetical protein E4U41_003895 [Claviceps citrina]|nr:hypothetical protein E4U41_003895 [Claviceps citrina]
MSGILRSKKGCWSCRLRKKKCDEGQPQCSTCESLRITCYGYGPKPQWMDNGEREQAMIEDFKRKIRITARQKNPKPRAVSEDLHQQQQPVLIAKKPEPDDLTVGNLDNNDKAGGRRPSDSGSIGMFSHPSATSDTHSAQYHLSSTSSPVTIASSDGGRPDSRDCSSRNSSVVPITARDSMLLMHFLDQVIPAQYPFYRPQPLDGGRGWLLSLLLHSKSLFHGALALSSYHRLISILAGARPACRALATVRYQQNLESCLREVRWTMQDMTRAHSGSTEFEAGTLLSIIQLVFSEISTGETDGWRMHLRGATEMYRCAMTEGARHAKPTEEALAVLRSSIPLEGEAATLCEDVSSMRFTSSAVLWLDIVASVTEGVEPKLLDMHGVDLGAGSGIRLEEVMGCQNMVMVQIARISALRAAIETDGFYAYDLEVADIQSALHQAKQQALALMLEEHEPQRRASKPISKITVLFSHAAGIYLHLAVKGFRDCYILQQITSNAMAYLRGEITADLNTGLACPLFLIGCAAATTEDQELLRAIFSSHQFLNSLFKHRAKLLPILEEVWKERWRDDDYSWSHIVRLTHDILLV